MTTEIVSRIQFALTIGFHIIFPTLNLGLGLYILLVESLWVKTRQIQYLRMARFWTKLFALTFGMGVVSGIVLAYELGTNFGPFMMKFGAVIGMLFSLETLTAFFLEAGFLGIMLFGWKRVSPKMHLLATCMVVGGTVLSAAWIMSSNSWMQSPAGFKIVDGQYVSDRWLDVIFNPMFIPRFLHMWLASLVTSGFVILGIAAYYKIHDRNHITADFSFKLLLPTLLVLIPLQIAVGDWVGLKVYHYQPIKTAAIEGLWKTQKGAPLILYAIPHQTLQKNFLEIKIPKLASLINTHALNGEMKGLDSVPLQDQPRVLPVFYGFRIMVGIGIMMLITVLLGSVLLYKKKLTEARWYQRLCLVMAPSGFIATISGWITAEVGRQPWIAYGLMRIRESIAAVSWHHVTVTLILFLGVYVFIFSAYLLYFRKIILLGPLHTSHDPIEAHLFQYMTATEDTEAAS